MLCLISAHSRELRNSRGIELTGQGDDEFVLVLADPSFEDRQRMHERTRVDYTDRSLPVEVDAARCVGPTAACTSSVSSSPTSSRSAAGVQATVA